MKGKIRYKSLNHNSGLLNSDASLLRVEIIYDLGNKKAPRVGVEPTTSRSQS
jgi:hypothetical protein